MPYQFDDLLRRCGINAESSIDFIASTGRVVPLGPNALVEAGGNVGRVWQHMQNSSFVILSAFRGEYSFKENLKRTAELLKEFRRHKLGGLQMEGHWIENDKHGIERDVKEISFIVPLTTHAINSSGKPLKINEFFNLANTMSKQFQQEGFLFGYEGKVYYHDVQHPHYSSFIGDSIALSQSSLERIYSKINNKKFIIKIKESKDFPFVIDGIRVPTNFANALGMKNLGTWV